VTEDDGEIDVVASVETFKTLSDRFRAANMIPEEAGLRMLPNQEMELSVEDTLQVLRAIESIEELDDVQNVYSNLKISDEAMAAMESE
jgi:transcriptional/translational regulatory protein YebC/TACO1